MATPAVGQRGCGPRRPPPADVDALVKTYCSEGVAVDYQRDLLSDHISLVATGAPGALNWLQSRLSGQPKPTGCSTTTTISTLLSPAALVELTRFLAGLAPYFD